ncbi:hypothetical protein H4R99_006903 [Coemansia sp. RSA 1722]|nr:hypothetical protein IWW45_004543 [Coemansia sp. RSA 485]KAJ2591019.1 hypothetical protein H4R99_006903 [Coemansia sp. RSA 1722]KAJ2640097.1 hypothetical protein GGF40_000245 [Coemansia sp. RSA 1286]
MSQRIPLPDSLYHVPRPRGRPPLADRQRNRLTLKLPGAASAAAAAAAATRGALNEAKPELEENEQQLEEQFILRVLPSMTTEFNRLVNERRIHEHLEIKFLDTRNATVRFNQQQYLAHLVDLPTVTEAYRTVDKKQMLKTADVCQMLVVDRLMDQGEEPVLARGIDVVWEDGLAVSLKNVRKERFRKRIPRVKVDAIEREVLRLLEEDQEAMAVKYELLDELNTDDTTGRGATPGIDMLSPVTLDDFSTPLVVDDDAASSVANDDLEFDESLAAELEQGLEELEEEVEEDDEDEESEEEEEEEEEEDQPNSERAMQIRLLGEEVAELDRTIRKKKADLDSAPNPIIRRRFEDIIQRLQLEMDAKKDQLEHYHREAAAEGAENTEEPIPATSSNPETDI